MKKVLVSGISGFLGSHIAAEGFRRGYQIRGTVRSEKKKESVLRLFAEMNPAWLPELVVADLLEPAGWDEAVSGCDGIMHVASPFILELPKHEDELIRPAVEGVRHVLEAAHRMGVRRIIQTSSIAAIMYGHGKEKTTFSEKDWTNPEGRNASPYTRSKTLAERAFWEMGEKYQELELSSICPGFVLGPLLNEDPGTSVEVLVRMMKGEYPGVPRLGFPTVDVRDVTSLHWDAFENNKSKGKRYPAVSSSVWFKDLAKMLLSAKPAFSGKVSTRELPDWFVRIFALFDKPTRMILPELGFCAEISAAISKEELGFNPRSVEEAVKASVESILEMKLVSIP